jgi:hypothetical protein
MEGMAEIESPFDGMDLTRMMFGVAEGLMVIDGVIYCDCCWVIRASVDGPCACYRPTAAKSCVECPVQGPCASCDPDRRARWEAAMARLEAAMGPLTDEDGERRDHEADWGAMEERYGALVCENCFVSYKGFASAHPPCHLCSPIYKADWEHAREDTLEREELERLTVAKYGALRCGSCLAEYGSHRGDEPCSSCDPRYKESWTKRAQLMEEEDEYERYSHRHCRD